MNTYTSIIDDNRRGVKKVNTVNEMPPRADDAFPVVSFAALREMITDKYDQPTAYDAEKQQEFAAYLESPQAQRDEDRWYNNLNIDGLEAMDVPPSAPRVEGYWESEKRLYAWDKEPELMAKHEKLVNKTLEYQTNGDYRNRDTAWMEIGASRRKVNKALAKHKREQARASKWESVVTDADDDTEAAVMPVQGLAFDLTNPALVKIVGITEARKSHLALHLAGTMRAIGGNVLYWKNEGATANIKARHRAWKQEYGLSEHAGNMHIVTRELFPLNLSDDENVTRFMDYASKYNPSMIIIDAFKGAYVADENDNTELGYVEDELLRIKEEMGVIVVVLVNTGKDIARGMRGAQVQKDKADTVLLVETKKDNKGEFVTTVKYDKQKELTKGQDLKFRWVHYDIEQGGKLVNVIVPVLDNRFDLSEAILGVVENSASPVGFRAIQNSITTDKGKPPTNDAMTKTLAEMVADGDLIKTADDKYTIPEF